MRLRCREAVIQSLGSALLPHFISRLPCSYGSWKCVKGINRYQNTFESKCHRRIFGVSEGNEFIMNAGICQSFNNSIWPHAGKKEREIPGVYYVGFRMEICAYVFHIAYAVSPTHSEYIRCPYCACTDCWHAGQAVGPLEILDWCLKLFWSHVLGELGGKEISPIWKIW